LLLWTQAAATRLNERSNGLLKWQGQPGPEFSFS